jgi:hypothetical protein
MHRTCWSDVTTRPILGKYMYYSICRQSHSGFHCNSWRQSLLHSIRNDFLKPRLPKAKSLTWPDFNAEALPDLLHHLDEEAHDFAARTWIYPLLTRRVSQRLQHRSASTATGQSRILLASGPAARAPAFSKRVLASSQSLVSNLLELRISISSKLHHMVPSQHLPRSSRRGYLAMFQS